MPIDFYHFQQYVGAKQQSIIIFASAFPEDRRLCLLHFFQMEQCQTKWLIEFIFAQKYQIFFRTVLPAK